MEPTERQEPGKALALALREANDAKEKYREMMARVTDEQAARRRIWVKRAAWDLILRHPRVDDVLEPGPDGVALRSGLVLTSYRLACAMWDTTEADDNG